MRTKASTSNSRQRSKDFDLDPATSSFTVTIIDDVPSITVADVDLPTLTLDESPLPGGDGDGTGIIEAPQSLANHNFADAINLDGHFVLGSNPEVQNSETQPFVSIHAVGSNAFDYYSLTVTQAGSTAVFDIDYAMYGFDSTLRLYDSSYNQLQYNDDYGYDPGTSHPYDSYMTYTFTQPGTYYIAVGQWPGSTVPAGAPYQLQVSLTNAIMGGDGSDGIWTATADFSGNFDFSYGADGPGSVSYALSLAEGDDGEVGSAVHPGLDEHCSAHDEHGDTSGKVDDTTSSPFT